jgi:Uncharacterized protein conserved in bacteria
VKKSSDNQVSIEIAYENAANLLEKKEFDLAEQQLSEILKKFPNDPNALRLSGVSSLKQEKTRNCTFTFFKGNQNSTRIYPSS